LVHLQHPGVVAAVGEFSQEEEGELGLQYFAVYIYELPCLISAGLGRMMSGNFHATGKKKQENK